MEIDRGLDTLLDMDGSLIQQENGFWVEIHVWRIEPTVFAPHGIRYALTLHERGGKRVMGYDNAHAVKPPGKFKYAGQIMQYDHKHRHISDKGVPYKFTSSYQLLKDFFDDVDKVMKEVE